MDRTRDNRQATVVYPARWRLLILVGTCLFFAAASAVATGSDNRTLAVIGLLGLVGFGGAAAVLLARALRPGPTVRVDAEGITDRTSLVPTGLVRWDEIAAVRKREIGKGMAAERMLEIVLLEPEEFRRRPRGVMRRLLDRYRELLKHPYVTIPGSMVSMPLGALVERMRQWRPELDVLELPPPPPRLFRRRQPARKHPDLPRW